MNLKEGTRRLAVLLGAIGCALGCGGAYRDGRSLWALRGQAQRFESLMAVPVVQEVEKLAKDFQATTRPTDFQVELVTLRKLPQGYKDELTLLLGDLRTPAATTARGPWDESARDSVAKASGTAATPPTGFVLDQSTFIPERDSAKAQRRGILKVFVDRDGIRSLTMDSNGDVQWFEYINGDHGSRTPAVPLTQWLTLALYPIAGFAVPWIAIHALAWVIAGFAAPRHQ